MARYLNAEEAAADGYRIEHEPERQRFVLIRDVDGSITTLGEAHYQLFGDQAADTAGINFDHTFVDPSLRGTGLSGVLARHAVTDDVVRDRSITASCWFIAGYLEKHPELAGNA